ncbi:MAG TPA: molybdate ABC transporter substrate-binding protein [Solirubrobacterales bacterium]|nr:molybdate ABC transporter substrate-binding protein [Solirubrobacterales bacterium]
MRGLLPSLLVAAAAGGALAGCGGDSSSADQPELVVFAASSLETAMSEYAESFSGADVKGSYAGSDQLAAQIRQGAPADVFASADTEYPAQLFEEGLVEKPRVFAGNRLVIAVPAGSEIDSLDDLTKPDTVLVIGDPSVPVGGYTRTVLDRLPAPQREAIVANVRSEEPEVSSVVAKLEQGAAEAGFVYATDVITAAGLETIALPERLQPDVAYAAAVIAKSEHKAEAERFVEGLIEGDGAEDLRRAGFLPPP